MSMIPRSTSTITVLGLALLMAVTRFHHEGSALVLPDASFAVFFLAGILSLGRWHLLGLIAVAGIVDILAISLGGVSGFCFSPAYGFLLPAYWLLWAAGRRCGRHSPLLAARQWVTAGAVLLISVSAAYGLSELAFFAFSGKFTGEGLMSYTQASMGYLPNYLGAAAFYFGIVLAARALLASRLRIWTKASV